MKGLIDKKRSKEIRLRFRDAYINARTALNLPSVDSSKQQISACPDSSGNGGPRAIVAYYAAIWMICSPSGRNDYDPPSIPLVIDCRNQQGQDSQNDFLILNASGGLEQGKAADYAMQLNLMAQVNLVINALPHMSSGGRIIFVTSHLAHFYGTGPACEGYEVVAASKRAGEDALRAMIPELASRGIRLIVVSGDLIEGTITPKLLERKNRGLIDKRKQAVGVLPNVEEFAAAITAAATSDSYSHGDTIYVGSTDGDGL